MRRLKGFTLIEVMIVIAIIAIIAAIAIPSFMQANGDQPVPMQVIDGCEYIQPDYDEWIHKGNCSNPIHNN